MHPAILKYCSGPLTDQEQDSLKASQITIRDVLQHRNSSLVELLTAIGVRLAADDAAQLNTFLEEWDVEAMKNASHPLTDAEIEFLDDMDAFIEYSIENGLRYEIVRA